MSEPQPTLRPTEPATLVVAGLAAAAVAWLLISNFYQQLPPMIWPAAVLIGTIAALEVLLGWHLWTRIHGRGPVAPTRRGRPGGGVPEPMAVARLAALAKASSLTGALLVGAYAGFLPWLVIESGRLSSAGAELPPTVGGLVASVALVAAAIWFERACRIPDDQDRDGGGGDGGDRDGRGRGGPGDVP